MIVIGIDPGLTGAIAILGHRGEYVGCDDMPTMQRQEERAYVKTQVNAAALADLLLGYTREYDRNEVQVFLESPVAFPGQHVAVTASTFLTAGIIEGVLAARHYAHHLVRPRQWKGALKLTSSKEQARAMAIRLFPQASLHRVKDHNRAEALLIAKYGHGLTA